MLVSVVALDIFGEKANITLIDFTRDGKALVDPTSTKLPLDQSHPFGLIHFFYSYTRVVRSSPNDSAQKEEVCQDSGRKLSWPMKFLPLLWAISTKRTRGGAADTPDNPS